MGQEVPDLEGSILNAYFHGETFHRQFPWIDVCDDETSDSGRDEHKENTVPEHCGKNACSQQDEGCNCPRGVVISDVNEKSF